MRNFAYSSAFRGLLKHRDAPDRFIEGLLKLVPERADAIQAWRRNRSAESLLEEIETILEKGCKDEHEFIYRIGAGGTADGSRDGGAEGAAGRSPNPFDEVCDASRPGESPGREDIPVLIGAKAREVAKQLARVVGASALSAQNTVVALSGPPRSGKSAILDNAMRRVLNESGMTVQSFESLKTYDGGEIIVCEDADVMINSIEDFTRLIRRALAPVVITCTDQSFVSKVSKTCQVVSFRTPELARDEIVDILVKVSVLGRSITYRTAERVVNLLSGLGTRMVLGNAMDVAVSLLYGRLLENPTLETLVSFADSEVVAMLATRLKKPVRLITEESVRQVRDALRSRIIGQDAVIERILPTLTGIAGAMTDPARPAGVIFMYGPTGTGKTELARVIADELFHGAFYKEDMGTYTDRYSTARLIGSPPGYIGYSDVPALIRFVDSHERGVVLFDEIEKSHDVVYDHILDLLDTGVLRDAMGNEHDMRGMLIMFTSNICVTRERVLGFGKAVPEQSDRERVLSTGVFRNEFVGRLQVVCGFEALPDGALREIAGTMLDRLARRLELVGFNVGDVSRYLDEVVAQYDPGTGARSMKNYVEIDVRNMILNGGIV